MALKVTDQNGRLSDQNSGHIYQRGKILSLYLWDASDRHLPKSDGVKASNLQNKRLLTPISLTACKHVRTPAYIAGTNSGNRYPECLSFDPPIDKLRK